MSKSEKMADDHETGQTGGQDIKAEARESIRKEIIEAESSSDPEEAKKKLAKKLVEELRDVVEEGKEVIKDIEEAKAHRRLPIKGDEAKKVLTSVVRVFEAAKQGIVITEKPVNQAFLKKLAEEIPSPTAEQSAAIAAYLTPYLLGEREIIINPPDQGKSQFQEDFERLAQVNPDLADRVKDALAKTAEEGRLGNLTKEMIERNLIVEGSKETSSGKKDETSKRSLSREEMQQRFNTYVEDFLRTVNNLRIEERIRPIIEERVRKENPSLDPNKPEERILLEENIRITIDREASAIRGDLRAKFQEVLAATTKEDLNSTASALADTIRELVRKGYLDDAEGNRLLESVNKLKEISGENIEQLTSRTNLSFEQELTHYNVTLTDQSKRLAWALFSTENFIQFLKQEGFIDENGRFKLERFSELYERIRELFEEIISVVDSKPGQYFDQAFNSYFEGAYYTRLLQRLKQRGEEIFERYSNLAESLVDIDDPRLLRYGYGDERVPAERFAYPGGKRTEKFWKAIGVILSQDMSRLLNVHRALHNIDYIVDEGAGWEELAKYADQLSTAEISWLFRINPDIVRAYNYYLYHLNEQLAMNGWVIPTDFGLKDIENLDYAQRMAVYQLMAEKGVSGVRNFYKLTRAARLASAIAKGVTGEFWSALMTSSLFTSAEIERGEGGEERAKQKYIYTGGHHKGVEKMLFLIDIVKVWERFNIPAEISVMRYNFIPRDLKKAGFQPWDHTKVYWVKKEYETARVLGASKEFLAFLKENALMGEVLRQPTLSVLTRAGWRAKEYMAFVRQTERGRIDFDQTINNLMMVGTYAVKAFLDDLSIGNIDPASIRDERLREEIIKAQNKKLTKKEREKIENVVKRELMKKYLFERLLAVRPTKVLTLEKRVFTPRGEILVQDLLVDFLKRHFGVDGQMVKDKILPLFLGGLKMAEDIVFRERQRLAKNNYYSGERIEDQFVFYQFDQYFLENGEIREDIKEKLRNFYRNFITTLGRELNYQGRQIDYSQIISEEAFLKTLPTFLRTLRQGITGTDERGNVVLKRHDVNREKREYETTLFDRFTELYSLGILKYELNGDDLDFGEFLLFQGGARMHARALGDAFSNASKIVPNYSKIFESAAIQLVKTKFKDSHQLEQFVEKTLTPVGKEICGALLSYAGKDEKDKVAIQMMMLLERLVGRDSDLRILFLGDLLLTARRNWTNIQGSLLQEYFPYHFTRPTYALNSDQTFTIAHKFLNDMDVPFEEERLVEIKEEPVVIKIFGKEIKLGNKKVRITEKNAYHIEQFEKIQGHDLKHRIIERFIPIAALIAILILIQLIREANKKNQKK